MLITLLVFSTICSGFLDLDFHIAGAVARQEFTLLNRITLLLMIFLVPLVLLVLLFAYHYRRKNKYAKYDPEWKHSTKIEVVCWGLSTFVLAIVAIATVYTTYSLDPYKEIKSDKKPITIQVISLNWKWLFIYPEENIATVNYIRVPKDTPVNFKITADSPMASFIIPELVGQVYAMSGMKTQLHMIANQYGMYEGRNVNYTGRGFSNMLFQTEVTTDKEYKAWLREAKSKNINHKLSYKNYKVLAQDSVSNPVEIFGQVDKGLFHRVYMSFMMPENMDMKNMKKGHNTMKTKHMKKDMQNTHNQEA